MNFEILKVYALSFLGAPYFFSGDDPLSGFDCSGLVCEMLRATGVVPYQFRTNAQGIYQFMKDHGHICPPQFGALSFYGKSVDAITHVGFCLDGFSMLEAGGGDSATLSEEIASRQNAFVRIRPVRFRKDFLFSTMPKYPACNPV